MTLHIGVYASEVGLVDHRELDLLCFVVGVLDGDVEVEGALEDGGVGYRGDGVEGEEFKGFLEPPDYAVGEEEEEACSHGAAKSAKLSISLVLFYVTITSSTLSVLIVIEVKGVENLLDVRSIRFEECREV